MKIEQLGLAHAAELDPDAFFDQMVAEAQASQRVVVGNFQFAAWSRV